MNAKGVTREQIEAAAKIVGGLRIYNLRPTGRRENGFTFTLKTDGPRWRKFSYHERRKVNGEAYRPTVPGAVCWHGHREFFRELFHLAPEARIRTGLATYRGLGHFEATHGATYGEPAQYVGFDLAPASVVLCECDMRERRAEDFSRAEAPEP